MSKQILASTWGLPLPEGVSLRTNEERRAVIVECPSSEQKKALFRPLGPGLPTPAQLICSRAVYSPCEIRFFCVKVGQRVLGFTELSVIEGCMTLEQKNGYPVLNDYVLRDLLGKSLDDGRSFGIVNMANNVSLFSSANIGKFSHCGDARNMHNVDVSQYWPDEELRRYRADLERHPEGLENYQYQARTFDGERMLFTVNARLWHYRGWGVVRVTETLKSESVIFEI